MKPPPLFSIQAPFACYNSSLPPAPPAILPHPVPVPHYFPQFFPWSSAPCSNVSIPLTPVLPWFHGSIFHLLFVSSSLYLYHPLFSPCYFFLSFFDRTKMQSTNKCHLALNHREVPGTHKKCLPQTVLGSCKPYKRLSRNTLLRGSRGYKVAKFR